VSSHLARLRPFCAITFAAFSACAAEAPPPRPFEARLAWAHLAEQVAFGPRVAGLAPHQRQRAWMRSQLGFRADTLVVQEFGEGKRRYANYFARWHPDARERVLLVTHWDSPQFATRDPEEYLRRRPVPGANEGASGTAVLMELAQILHETAPAIGVDMLFTDGLEGGHGARHFAARLPPGYAPRWAVYVDRVGDADLVIPMEASSLAAAPAAVKRVWDAARAAGMDSVFVARTGAALEGDHQVLNRAGIPTAAVIDPEHGRGNELWRTVDDHVSAVKRESLGVVGAVLAALVYGEKP
jgi:hypothetical protein